MFPFDPVTAGTMLVLAVSNPKICQMPQPAAISVVPKTAELVIDTTKSHAELQTQGIDTINPYGYNQVTHTNGFMAAELGMSSSVSLDYKQAPRMNAFCIWYEKITVNIDIKPKIVIAKEVAADKCMYRAVLRHEMKHVNADRRIANKYAKTIGKKIYDGLTQRGFIAGPIRPENVQKVQTRMQKTVSQLMEFEYKKLELERMEVQQAIDNIQEYESVKAECPDYKPSVAASRSRY